MTPKILTPKRTTINRVVLYNRPGESKIWIEIAGSVVYEDTNLEQTEMNKTLTIDLSRELLINVQTATSVFNWLSTKFKNSLGLV